MVIKEIKCHMILCKENPHLDGKLVSQGYLDDNGSTYDKLASNQCKTYWLDNGYSKEISESKG